MKVVLAGGSGLIGSELAKSLIGDGHKVVILTRNPARVQARISDVHWEYWDGRTANGWGKWVESADAIVNLTGENLSARRWTQKQKKLILSSRINSGKAIVQAIEQAKNVPGVLIQASGAGYYGVASSDLLDETVGSGSDFLSRIAREWEDSTRSIEMLGVRRVIIRSGVVLSSKGGALERMLLPFRLFVGGPLGSGKQWLSWIHIQDEVRAIRFLIENQNAHGAFNLSAIPIQNREFSKTVGKILNRPSFINIPALILQIVLGEMSTMVLDGQRISSQKLIDHGFQFQFPEINVALADLLTKDNFQRS